MGILALRFMLQDHDVSKRLNHQPSLPLATANTTAITRSRVASEKYGGKKLARPIKIRPKDTDDNTSCDKSTDLYVEDRPGKRKRIKNVRHENYIVTNVLPISPYTQEQKAYGNFK